MAGQESLRCPNRHHGRGFRGAATGSQTQGGLAGERRKIQRQSGSSKPRSRPRPRSQPHPPGGRSKRRNWGGHERTAAPAAAAGQGAGDNAPAETTPASSGSGASQCMACAPTDAPLPPGHQSTHVLKRQRIPDQTGLGIQTKPRQPLATHLSRAFEVGERMRRQSDRLTTAGHRSTAPDRVLRPERRWLPKQGCFGPMLRPHQPNSSPGAATRSSNAVAVRSGSRGNSQDRATKPRHQHAPPAAAQTWSGSALNREP